MAKKKSFLTDNPTLDFISRESIEAIEDPDREAGVQPVQETKTLRKQIVMQPSLYRQAKAAATREGISFNELVHRALRAYLED